jgi:two-component system response regulator YesN
MLAESLAENSAPPPLPPTLVVEDNRLNRQCLVRLLQHAGIRADSANTLSDGLEKLQLRPRIVLLDVELPDGSGSEILAHIRQHQMPIKVCVIAGGIDFESAEVLSGLKPDGLFLKPYHVEDVLRWVAQAMLDG